MPLARSLGEHLLQHQVVIDGRHAPVDGLDGAAFDRALGELVGISVCAWDPFKDAT